MCYAIPGKIVEVNSNVVTLDYFGEKKRAYNDFFSLAEDEYVYAQGGFVVQKIPSAEAVSILSSWQELFAKLKEVDLALTQKPKNIFQNANFIRQKNLGNACCIHGIIEFSNYCACDCLYCGIRKSNAKVRRYRMSVEEILSAAKEAVNKLGFKALVLQSGEDSWYTQEKLIPIIKNIKEKFPCLIALSIGEREVSLYKKLFDAGARALLLRFETSNPQIYEKMRPGHNLETRINLIKQLRQIGYLIMTGFLIGLPGQTEKDLINDIELCTTLGADMFSFGPLIAHPQTPLANISFQALLDKTLNTIAKARLKNPQAKILVTTSLETLDKENGLKFGLLSGANSLMINVTPSEYKSLYEIYPERAGVNIELSERINSVIKLLHSLGRAPADIGV